MWRLAGRDGNDPQPKAQIDTGSAGPGATQRRKRAAEFEKRRVARTKTDQDSERAAGRVTNGNPASAKFLKMLERVKGIEPSYSAWKGFGG